MKLQVKIFASLIVCGSLWTKELSLQDAMTGATVQLLKFLQGQGYEKIGPKSIEELIKKSSKTKWNYLPLFFVAGENGDRHSGLSLVEENVVSFGPPFLEAYKMGAIHPAPLNAFAFHESLGANGVTDTHYGVSLSVTFLCNEFDQVPSPDLYKIFAKRLNTATTFKKNVQVASLGGSGVGGGGDIAALDLKYKLILGVPFRLAHPDKAGAFGINPEEALNKILDMNVRVSYEKDELKISKDKAGNFSAKIYHNKWFAANHKARVNYQMKVAMLMLYLMSHPEKLVEQFEVESVETGPLNKDLATDVKEVLRTQWASRLDNPDMLSLHGLDKEQALLKIQNLKIINDDSGAVELSVSSAGRISVTLSSQKWQNQKGYRLMTQIFLSLLLGDMDYEIANKIQ